LHFAQGFEMGHGDAGGFGIEGAEILNELAEGFIFPDIFTRVNHGEVLSLGGDQGIAQGGG